MTDAETLAFKTGYLLACCNLQNLHDQPGMARDVLGEAGITTADVKAMGLSGYDAKALREIRQCRDDPIIRTKRKR
jgi:hypothetical protein